MAIAKPQPIKETMVYEKSTKGTFVYVATDFGMPVSTLYIRKEAYPSGPPSHIEIVITPKG